MLTRSEFCEITGIDPARFQSLARKERNQLPFVESDVQGWRRYKVGDALRMAVMMNLTDNMGMSNSLAQRIVIRAFDGFTLLGFLNVEEAPDTDKRFRGLISTDDHEQIWIGSGCVPASGYVMTRDMESFDYESPIYVGTISRIFHDFASQKGMGVGFVVVNISEAFQMLLERAVQAGINLYPNSEGGDQ